MFWPTLFCSICFWKLDHVVNLLYLFWWSLHLVVDFDRDTLNSWRVFLIWPTVLKDFFPPWKKCLLSSCTIVFSGFQCFHFTNNNLSFSPLILLCLTLTEAFDLYVNGVLHHCHFIVCVYIYWWGVGGTYLSMTYCRLVSRLMFR